MNFVDLSNWGEVLAGGVGEVENVTQNLVDGSLGKTLSAPSLNDP